MVKRTPLYNAHLGLGARLIDFNGWEMPIQYSGIVDEHKTVRAAAGLFDISHMGEVQVIGPAAGRFLNRILTNDINKLSIGQGQYTLMCQERGGVIDDLYLYRLGSEYYLLVINAARIDVDLDWLNKQFNEETGAAGTELIDASDQYGAVAVQGPRVAEFIDACFNGKPTQGAEIESPSQLKKNWTALFPWGNTGVWVSRTGYTGEDGFEIISPANHIESVWETLLNKGRPFGLKPGGLGARDTLRIEACLPLYGHELDESTTPLEAGLGFAVALQKQHFIGRSALAYQWENGIPKRCVAFKVTAKSPPPRQHYSIWTPGESGEKVGTVASGTQSPILGVGVGQGYVPPALASPNTEIEIDVRGKRVPALIARKPLHRNVT